MTRAVLFDLDDTLIDSSVGYVRTMWRTCDALGLPRPPECQIREVFPTWQEHVERLLPGLPFEVFAARYRSFVEEIPYRAIPGAVATLEALANRRLGVVTNRSRELCRLRMAQAEIPEEAFEFILTVEDLPEAKPSPRAFAPVLPRLAPVSRYDMVYVGDRCDDARAARGAGIAFVGVLTGSEGPEQFESAGVARSRLLQSVCSLPAFLEAGGVAPHRGVLRQV